ncbi:unnamed protein product [Brassicogethes aeneus]|uniref:Uncharacterized protein n=1 Tax=Brassicogethes aeneus TaxID=1431903 RepID=A0A9P0AXU7_BRAAE|nr:unnamed protein product [Brassicogethes aeneus]
MKTKFLFRVFGVLIVLQICDGRRYGGGSSSRSRTSYSSHSSPSRPSYQSYASPSRPSYISHPSPSIPSPPSHSRPSYPSYNHPSPNSGTNTHANTNSKPIGWNTHESQPAGPPKTNLPTQQNSGSRTHDSVLPVATQQKTSGLGNAPQGPPIQPGYTQGTANQPPPYNAAGHYPQQQQYPPAYPGHAYPPAYPGHGYPPAYPGHAYPPPGYPGHYPQGGGTTIINNNNIVGGGGGYGGGYPSYHYQSSDTGSGTLGFFLGYSLAKITTPTYHYSSNSYDGYRPRYDHYEVHHYYHDNNVTVIEKERVIQSNTIMGCVGDSGSICPANTTSLCTNTGAIMCVTSATSATACKDVKDANCIKSTVPCVDKNAPGCKDNPQNTTTVNIPCISTAKIYGNITYVNNTIVVENANATMNVTSNNSTMSSNATETTTPAPATTPPPNVKPEEFCVTILALPAVRKVTEGEKVYNEIESTVTNFLGKSLGTS